MERERLKTLLWPVGGAFNRYYKNFEQRVNTLDPETIEQELQAPTYKHQLREMFLRLGIGLALFTGIASFVKSIPSEQTAIYTAYLFSMPLQYIATILPSVTRSIMIETEQQILQQELAKRQQLN